MKIKANGISINYEIEGKGKNLVLIHAVGDNLNVWYNQVPAFSKSYRVITYDMRGFGKSESPEAEKYPVSLMVEDAYQLMKAIKVEEAYFLGHSLGGRIALDLAIEHPEMVKALIFANSSPALTPPMKRSEDSLARTLADIEKRDIKSLAESSMNTFVAPEFRSKNPAEYEKYLKIKMQNTIDGVARITRATLLSPPTGSPPDLSKVKCPLLLIVGEKDISAFIEGAKNIHQALPGSQIVFLPTGHAAAVEMPDRFNSAVLDFLAGMAKK